MPEQEREQESRQDAEQEVPHPVQPPLVLEPEQEEQLLVAPPVQAEQVRPILVPVQVEQPPVAVLVQ